MYKLQTLKNNLTLITFDMPELDSVTTLVAVAAGSRHEVRKTSGISHFLEHMFFKGSRKYPTAEIINTLIDGVGAINNASTGKEYTYYWVKSANKHLELATDVTSSMLKESLMADEEIEREKGVIIEELKMYRDTPASLIWDLYERLQFGDQPLGWDIGGNEQTIKSFKRADFIKYIDSLYSPPKMVLAYAGKIPSNIVEIAEKHFGDLPKRSHFNFPKYKKIKQSRPKVAIHYKKTDQAHIVLGVEGFSRSDPRRYTASVLGTILGRGMSSRLFMEVRERRGLAYSIMAGHNSYEDTGSLAAYAGLKMEKMMEGLEVIKTELLRTAQEQVTPEELQKAKEMLRGRTALNQESTNFMAEYGAIQYVLKGEIESFDDYMSQIDKVTLEDVEDVAQELFQKNKYNLQIIGPFKSATPFETLLSK